MITIQNYDGWNWLGLKTGSFVPWTEWTEEELRILVVGYSTQSDSATVVRKVWDESRKELTKYEKGFYYWIWIWMILNIFLKWWRWWQWPWWQKHLVMIFVRKKYDQIWWWSWWWQWQWWQKHGVMIFVRKSSTKYDQLWWWWQWQWWQWFEGGVFNWIYFPQFLHLIAHGQQLPTADKNAQRRWWWWWYDDDDEHKWAMILTMIWSNAEQNAQKRFRSAQISLTFPFSRIVRWLPQFFWKGGGLSVKETTVFSKCLLQKSEHLLTYKCTMSRW